MNGSELNTQVQNLEDKVRYLETRIAGLSNAASQRATETYERSLRERVLMMHIADVNCFHSLESTEEAVRYIMDGPQ